jgi:hypothetical protein
VRSVDRSAPRRRLVGQPAADEDPSWRVRAVVRYTEDPVLRRAVRVDGGWMERGALVDGTGRPSAIPWERVGSCWADRSHPVVAIESNDTLEPMASPGALA